LKTEKSAMLTPAEMIFAPNTILPAGTDHPAQPPPLKLNRADVATPYPGRAVRLDGEELLPSKAKAVVVEVCGRVEVFDWGGADGAGVVGASSLVIVPITAAEVPIV
jgi:hypothetical protein